jgi:hypothetical protein
MTLFPFKKVLFTGYTFGKRKAMKKIITVFCVSFILLFSGCSMIEDINNGIM